MAAKSFALAFENIKTEYNIGGAMRSALNFGASAIYTIGKRYRRTCQDVLNASGIIPTIHCADWNDYRSHAPFDWIPVVIELCGDAIPLPVFSHPKRCVYIFGPEDGNVSKDIQKSAHARVFVPTVRCMNVAVCAAVVMYDRWIKECNRNDR